MNASSSQRQYTVQKSPRDPKQMIWTDEPFEVLVSKYFYVKMLS